MQQQYKQQILQHRHSLLFFSFLSSTLTLVSSIDCNTPVLQLQNQRLAPLPESKHPSIRPKASSIQHYASPVAQVLHTVGLRPRGMLSGEADTVLEVAGSHSQLGSRGLALLPCLQPLPMEHV